MPRVADWLHALALPTVLLGAVLSCSARAEDDERWYKVELLVFTRDPVTTGELFPPSPELAYPERARFLLYPQRVADVEREHPNSTAVDDLGRIVITLPPPEGAIFPPPEKPPETAPAPQAAVEQPGALLPAVPPVAEQTLRPTPFVALAADHRELGTGAARLARGGGATVQFHETWLQPIPAEAEALPLVLDNSGDAGQWPELQGSVLLYRSRYLHIEANLWRNTDGRGLPAGWRMSPPPLGPEQLLTRDYQPALLAPLSVGATRFAVDFEGLPVLAPAGTGLEPVYPYRRAIRFDERRRMKRNELHYLDHPAMGVVIKITALDEDALESWAEAELMQADTWPASLTRPAGP